MLAAEQYEVAKRWSWKGVIATLRASAFLFSHDVDDVNAALGRGALHINLWHGVGLKKLHVGRRPISRVAGWFRSFLYAPHDIVVATSPMMVTYFTGEFGIPPQRCPQLGYPRLDAASDPALAEAARSMDRSAGFRLNPRGFSELYLYAPTFRDTGRPFLKEAFPDLERLSVILSERNALLFVKLHEQTREKVPDGFRNIVPWPTEIDFHPYLGELTGLITDYSSIIYDYIFVKNEGALLYTFDYEEYIDKDRQMVFSFEENVAGLRIATFEALCRALRDGIAFNLALREGVDRVRERYWSGSATPASPAVVDYVERRLAGD